jgi:hypothetical protein
LQKNLEDFGCKKQQSFLLQNIYFATPFTLLTEATAAITPPPPQYTPAPQVWF